MYLRMYFYQEICHCPTQPRQTHLPSRHPAPQYAAASDNRASETMPETTAKAREKQKKTGSFATRFQFYYPLIVTARPQKINPSAQSPSAGAQVHAARRKRQRGGAGVKNRKPATPVQRTGFPEQRKAAATQPSVETQQHLLAMVTLFFLRRTCPR